MSFARGVYVHLPYCASRCGYCAFVVSTDASTRDSYLAALTREIHLAASEAQGEAFDSVYLGGGTPSQIPIAPISDLLGRLRTELAICPGAEITMEANPDDVTRERAWAWREAGVGRVSLGVQSFSDRELSAVGRRHDAEGARRALGILRDTGFSVSADLILGLPEQTAAGFRSSVDELVASGVGHVSVYLLEIEKSKSLEEDRRSRPERYLTDDEQADLWLELCATLARTGLRHYEISNWAAPGKEARHNLKYWRRVPTLGLGVSAHELWDERRRANVSAIPAYLERLEAGVRPTAMDRPIDEKERTRERIVLGLRLSEGVSDREIQDWIGENGDPSLSADYATWLGEGWLARSAGRTALTEPGFLVSNEILCRFV